MQRLRRVAVAVAIVVAIVSCQTGGGGRGAARGAEEAGGPPGPDRENVLVQDGLAWTLPAGSFVRAPRTSEPPGTFVVAGQSGVEVLITIVPGESRSDEERTADYMAFLYPGAEKRTIETPFSQPEGTIPMWLMRDNRRGTSTALVVFSLDRVLVSLTATTAATASTAEAEITTTLETLLQALRPVDHDMQMRVRGSYAFFGTDDGWRWRYDLPDGAFFEYSDGAVTAFSLTISEDETFRRESGGGDRPFETPLFLNGERVVFSCTIAGGRLVCVGEQSGRSHLVILDGAVPEQSPEQLISIVDQFLFDHIALDAAGGDS